VFSTSSVFLTTTENIAELLSYNAIKEGLPFHNHVAAIGKNSLFRRMSSKARVRLFKEIPHIAPAKVEALLAATIMHSADHYYLDQHLGFDARTEFLESDFTLIRATILGPNTYFSRKLLCREQLTDPICKILYEAAKSVDPVFANDGLFISVTN
jgi:hypothetical protein